MIVIGRYVGQPFWAFRVLHIEVYGYEEVEVKFSHFSILAALGAAAAAPMFIKGPNGEPLMSFDDWVPQDAIALVDKVSDLTVKTKAGDGAASSSGKQIFYKWKDEHGVWQMTHYRPTHLADEDIDERIIYANANIIQSLSSEQMNSTEAVSVQSKKKFAYNPSAPDLSQGNDKDNEDDDFSLTTVPMTKIPDLLNQAQGVDATMKQRMEVINKHSR